MTGAKIFVGAIFVVLGVAFVASTALLVYEFQGMQVSTWLLMHSHLFLFFPVFGLVALAAFYLPATVFTHMYWTHVPYGRLRFTIGAAVAVAASIYFSYGLTLGSPRGLWELSPRVLKADVGVPSKCGEPGNGGIACQRAPLMVAVDSLRAESQTRVGLSKFSRTCAPDPLLEEAEDRAKLRFCFPAQAKLNAVDCCRAQSAFRGHVGALYADPKNRSDAARFDFIFMTLKAFFVIVVVFIGILLVLWRHTLERLYPTHAIAIERSMLVGAAAMLVWPMMDYAYHQTALSLFGRVADGPHIRLSLVIGPWALLLLFYFLGRLGRKVERLGQVVGGFASLLAVLRYEQVNDWAVRLVGMGGAVWEIGAMVLVALVGWVLLLLPYRGLKPPKSEPAFPLT
jgi:hypothetical protein